MLSSGETPISTASDNPVDVIENAAREIVRDEISILNGAVAGYFSIDGGKTWAYLPASRSTTIRIAGTPFAPKVQVKRVPAGSDLTDVYAFAT